MAKKTNTLTAEKAVAKIRKPKAAKAESRLAAVPGETPTFTITHHDIATLAFSYWQSRGCQDGSQQDDWDRAERELRSLLG